MSYMYQYVDILDDIGLNHSDVKKRDDDKETVRFQFTTDLIGKPLDVVVTIDSVSVAQNVFGMAKIPNDKMSQATVLCNELNSEYRFVKFYIDSDNDFVIENDAFLDEHSAGEEVFAVTKLMLDKLDSIYRRLMKAIWA